MQTILGANGIIATEIAKVLPQYTNRIRLVSRTPKKVNESDELFVADLLDAQQTYDAVRGSEVVYLTAGLKYNIKIWEKQWPILMKNVIDACKAHKAKLVFFDNVYMYGYVENSMTEATPIKPSSQKGEVRAKIAQMILDEVANGSLEALIARAADFYGPNTPLSFVNIMVFENLAKGKSAQWLMNDTKVHSLSFTPDAGRATALLGNTPSAFGQVWHVPTAANPLTGKQIVALAAEALGQKNKHINLPKWMIVMLGWFIPEIGESVEMLYQSTNDYVFDSSKFDKAFPDFETTSYQKGIQLTAASFMNQQ